RDGIEYGVAAEEPHLAGRGLDEPEHHPQRRRLARPVRPQVAVDIAGLDGDVDAGDGLERPVRLAQGPGGDGGYGLGGVAHSPRATASTSDRGMLPVMM